MLRRILLSLLFIFYQTFLLFGQLQSNELPVQFFQLPQSYALIHPSYAAIDSGLTVTSGNKMNFGSFKIFRTHYINAILRIAPRKEYPVRKNHGIGITLLTDRDGDYIQHNRFYVNYAYRISLSEGLSLAAGVTLGAANVSIESSTISPPGSSLKPDAALGGWLQYKRSFLAISFNQILASRIRPIQETLRLVPHFNITSGSRFILTPYLEYWPVVNLRLAGSGIQPDLDFMNKILLQQLVSAGFNYRHHQGIVLFAGFENLVFGQGRHRAAGWFSYNIPFSGYILSNLQTYEITLSYKIH